MPSAKKKTAPREVSEETTQITVRVPNHWLGKMDTIAQKITVPGIKMTRTDIARRAMAIGIDELVKHPR
jgi:hypothetical protein